MYKLDKEQTKWASRCKQGISPQMLRTLIVNQKGKCKLTNTKMLFNKTKHGTAEPGKGVHPLYAAIDHIHPKDKGKRKPEMKDIQLLCYAINDMKGHIPPRLFDLITGDNTEWKQFKRKWNRIRPRNAKSYYRLIRFGT
jgi:5-methylcytosine-specific restriction endonuclease McrA